MATYNEEVLVQFDSVKALTVANASGNAVCRVNTLTSAAGTLYALELYPNGENVAIVGGANAVAAVFSNYSTVSGVQSNSLKGCHFQVLNDGSCQTTGTGGKGVRAGHFAALHNSTATCAEINGTQSTVSIGKLGSSVNVGEVALAIAHRVQVKFETATLTGNVVKGVGLYVQKPANLGVGRTIGEMNGIEIESLAHSAVSKSRAIKTGTGAVEFGDKLFTGKGIEITSASVITLNTGNYTVVSGGGTIEGIVETNLVAGFKFALRFKSATTLKHNAAVAVGSQPFYFSTLADKNVAANEIIEFIYDNTYFFEV